LGGVGDCVGGRFRVIRVGVSGFGVTWIATYCFACVFAFVCVLVRRRVHMRVAGGEKARRIGGLRASAIGGGAPGAGGGAMNG
jgi:hypothetical protein